MRKDLQTKFTKDFLEQEIKTKFIRQIAEENNTTPVTIYKFLNKFQISTPPKSEKEFLKLNGKRYGKLVVIEYGGVDSFGKTLLICQCDCGNKTKLNKSSLSRNLTSSCGCIKQEKARKNFYGDVGQAYFTKIKKSAEERNISFEITQKDIWEKYLEQNRKCALSNVDVIFYSNYDKQKLQTASVDRIRPEEGYTASNIQIVHKRVNILKGNLTEEELKFWIWHIFQTIKPDNSFDGKHRDILCNYKNP